MEVIFILIILSLIVAVGFLFAFIWAVRDGQYEDDYTPAVRILFDDGVIKKDQEEEKSGRQKSTSDEIQNNNE